MKQCPRDVVFERVKFVRRIPVPQHRSPAFPSLDQLDTRRLLTVSLNGGALDVTGTAKNDVISLFVDAKDPTTLDVKLNKTVTPFVLTNVQTIFIEGFAGNDMIVFTEA